MTTEEGYEMEDSAEEAVKRDYNKLNGRQQAAYKLGRGKQERTRQEKVRNGAFRRNRICCSVFTCLMYFVN